MGAADVVPGVSGGTIAFISGIYEELLDSIRAVDAAAFRLLLTGKIAAFWEKINGTFLAVLLAGIGTSILSLSKLILYLLEHQAVLVWSFFFGLIIASALLIRRQVTQWSAGVWVSFVLGAAVAFYITTITTVADQNANLLYVLLCGAVAICAMILPGISGSFILLLMGAYQLILGSIRNAIDALTQADFSTLWESAKIMAVFGIGCVAGLAGFSRLLSWLFHHYHNIVVAALIGFLLGSLNKVWPWKETLIALGEKHKIETNVWPSAYEAASGQPAHLFWAILLAVVGFALVYGLDRIAAHLSEKKVG